MDFGNPKMTKRLVLATAWLAICGYFVVSGYTDLVGAQHDTQRFETAVRNYFVFSALSFPTGPFLTGVVLHLFEVAADVGQSPLVEFFVVVSCSIAAGFLQWFVFVPWGFNRVRAFVAKRRKAGTVK